jgi:hypothetical protein
MDQQKLEAMEKITEHNAKIDVLDAELKRLRVEADSLGIEISEQPLQREQLQRAETERLRAEAKRLFEDWHQGNYQKRSKL